MRRLVLTPKFKRSYRRFVRKGRALQKRIEGVLLQMSEDISLTQLGIHKLSGELTGLWACSCGYDCRIVFSFETDEVTGREVILLIDIGTHDEVY